jgi:hypothetical protein
VPPGVVPIGVTPSRATLGNPYTAVADDIYKPKPSTFFQQTESNVDFEIPELAKIRGVPKAQVIDDLNKKLERLMGDANTYVRIPDEGKILESIIKDGRLKTQFESGSSNGVFDQTYRAQKEAKLFGVPETAEAASRPVYGYVSSNADGLVPFNSVSHYGRVALKLKPHKRPGTTITGGDSLFTHYKPTPMNKSTVDSFDAKKLDSASSIEEASRYYVEAQIGGGVNLATDVSEVLFYGSVDSYLERVLFERFRAAFEKFGVTVRFVIGE